MKTEGGFRKTEFRENLPATITPVVTIVTVVYNNQQHIERTMLSVLNQSFKNKEYLIIDGGSQDGTLQLVKKYESAIDYWQSEPDQGIYDAMNKGLHLAKGQFILFLNSGDRFAEERVLEKVFGHLKRETDVLYGETNLMDESGNILGIRSALTTRKLPENLSWKDMQKGMVVSHQSIFVKRELAPDFDLKYRCSADIDWVIESLKRSKKVVNSHTIISDYLVGGFSIRHQKMSWKERFDIFSKHFGFFKTLWIHAYIMGRSIAYKWKGKTNY